MNITLQKIELLEKKIKQLKKEFRYITPPKPRKVKNGLHKLPKL